MLFGKSKVLAKKLVKKAVVKTASGGVAYNKAKAAAALQNANTEREVVLRGRCDLNFLENSTIVEKYVYDKLRKNGVNIIQVDIVSDSANYLPPYSASILIRANIANRYSLETIKQNTIRDLKTVTNVFGAAYLGNISLDGSTDTVSQVAPSMPRTTNTGGGDKSTKTILDNAGELLNNTGAALSEVNERGLVGAGGAAANQFLFGKDIDFLGAKIPQVYAYGGALLFVVYLISKSGASKFVPYGR